MPGFFLSIVLSEVTGLEIVAKALQAVQNALFADFCAVSGKKPLVGAEYAGLGGETETDCTDRFLKRAAVRAGDTGR